MADRPANGNCHNGPLWEKVRLVLRSDLSAAEKLLLIALADYGGQDGVAFPSQDTLARDVSLKPRQVRNVIATTSMNANPTPGTQARDF
jgi:hypothetical protein